MNDSKIPSKNFNQKNFQELQQPHEIGSCDQGAELNDQKFRSYSIWISNNHKWERVFRGEIKDE